MKKTAKKLKRALACMLAVVMVLCAVPMSGFVGLELPVLSQLFTTKVSAVSEEGGYKYIAGDGEAYITGIDSSISGDIVIPDVIGGYPVKSIGGFRDCDKITSVTIPDSVTEIDDYAFDSCYNLVNVSMPESLVSIGKCAFFNCYNLSSITIPENVVDIGDFAFEYCSGLSKIVWNARNVNYFDQSSYVFDYSGTSGEGIDVVFGNSVESIPAYLFYGDNSNNYDLPNYTTPNVKAVTIGNNVKYIGHYSFCLCDSISSIDIPDSVISIGNSAFFGCENVTSITIGNNVKSIGETAFCRCYSLNRINWNAECANDCESNDAIFSNVGITSMGVDLIFGDNVQSIPDYLFYADRDCDIYIKSVSFGKSIERIGKYAFGTCKYLPTITIPDSVTSIGDAAFINCMYLTNIVIGSENSSFTSVDGALYNKEKTEILCYPAGISMEMYEIRDSVTKIREGAFGNCSNLTSIIIPSSIKSIETYAFYYCYNLKDVYYTGTEEQWNNIAINYAFGGNDALENATIHFNYSNHTHSYIADVTTPATCVSDGVMTYTCSCGDSYTEAIPATGHSYVAEVTAPTCTKDGYTTHTCSVCGDTYTDSAVTALGHSFTNYASDKNATCTADGTKTAKCDRCDVTNTVMDKGSKLAHTIVIDKAVEPTCSKSGRTEGQHCSVCGTVLVAQKTIPATGHNYVAEVTAPTCTKDGYTTHICSVCGDAYTDSAVTALGHSFTNYVSDKNATCTADGTKTAKCDWCDATNTVTDKGSKLAHTIVIDKAVEPTCSKSGLTEGQHCSVCGTILVTQKIIPATGHADKNADGKCDDCGGSLGAVKNCTHLCHKTGFLGFIWKIVNFFNKLFRINKTCSCGMRHY